MLVLTVECSIVAAVAVAITGVSKIAVVQIKAPDVFYRLH
jgi:hypothetical protein